MGLIFSCCYRQRRPISEREPLLPKHHITDVVDPFTPSQDQLNKIAESDVLSEDHEFGYGPLSEPGKEAVKSIREVIESFSAADDTLQDFMFQCSLVPSLPVHADIAVEMDHVNEEALAQELPSEVEIFEDTSSLIRSLQTLLRILLTSSVFRLLLRDIFIVARDMAGDAVIAAKDEVADVARAIERTAQFVESAAELVEDVAQNVVDATRSRPSAVEYEGNPGETIRVETQIPTLESDIFSSEVPIHVNPERLKEVAVSRLQQAIIQAHADPSFRTALRTILILVRKYTNKVRSTTDRLSDAQMPNFQPILWADPPLVNALSQLSTLLSRMASNRAMEPVLRAFHALVVDLADIPNALISDIHSQNSQTFFAFLDSLGLWFDRALSDPQFVLSEEGKRNLDGLYDRARNLVDEASHSDMDWIRHLRMLLHEINLFASALMEDKTTHRLLDALTTLSSSLSSFTQTAVIAAPGKLDAAKQKVRADLQRDLLRWLLPRLLRALHAIPMPRIEYRSTGSNLDAAIDTLYLTPSSAQASLVPDHVRICNWTELHLNVAEVNPQTDTIIPAYALPHGGMKTYSRVRVSVDGVRLSARDVGYYVCWKASVRNG
ncbi:hypothetical protein EW026_g1404 [Hermanssonia centrifuga]|uniref:HAM1-like N-terminal domain-containing protein n=1 Tax=Hermanssonia centrifuga TaxID=98765 RepID=A0A4S4KTA9_9APHY|nr:hypothetical protein EW026_g1404 [Hermanssonia centrifuga]